MEEKLLIIDDDAKLRALLTDYLQGYGFEVITLPDGLKALQTIKDQEPDLVILDVMMPVKDGLQVLGEIRTGSAAPVIMLTAKGEDADRIVGLELGADDYLPKPFNPRELLARIRAVLRRLPLEAAAQAQPEQIVFIEASGLKLNTAGRCLVVDDEELELSATEYKIIKALMSRPGVVFTRDQLLNLSRGRDLEAFDRSVDVHISNLRAKLKPWPQHRKIIKTVWGTGYMLVETP